jgi:hypothetical protein
VVRVAEVQNQISGTANSVAEQRDELAALHSITSSAATSRPGGTVRPSPSSGNRFELGRRLHRKVGRLVAAQDAVHISCGLPKRVD